MLYLFCTFVTLVSGYVQPSPMIPGEVWQMLPASVNSESVQNNLGKFYKLYHEHGLTTESVVPLIAEFVNGSTMWNLFIQAAVGSGDATDYVPQLVTGLTSLFGRYQHCVYREAESSNRAALQCTVEALQLVAHCFNPTELVYNAENLDEVRLTAALDCLNLNHDFTQRSGEAQNMVGYAQLPEIVQMIKGLVLHVNGSFSVLVTHVIKPCTAEMMDVSLSKEAWKGSPMWQFLGCTYVKLRFLTTPKTGNFRGAVRYNIQDDDVFEQLVSLY